MPAPIGTDPNRCNLQAPKRVTSSVKMSTIQQLKNFIRHGMLCSFPCIPHRGPRLNPSLPMRGPLFLLRSPQHHDPGFLFLVTSSPTSHITGPAPPQMTPADRSSQASKLGRQTPTRPRGKTNRRRPNLSLSPCPPRPCLLRNQSPASALHLATRSHCLTRTRPPLATQ